METVEKARNRNWKKRKERIRKENKRDGRRRTEKEREKRIDKDVVGGE